MKHIERNEIYLLAVPSIFVWIGFICAISFMESWLKFRAPGVSLPVGLGIGNLVFGVMNKIEWVLAFVTAFAFYKLRPVCAKQCCVFFGIAFFILLLQTFWLLPALDKRVMMYTAGTDVPKSSLHIFYIVSEVIKLSALMVLGIQFLKLKYG